MPRTKTTSDFRSLPDLGSLDPRECARIYTEVHVRVRLPFSFSIAEFAFAILAIALTTVVLLAVRDQLNSPIVGLLYLLPVVLSAARGGLGPGIAAALCAFLAFNFFFLQPYYTLTVHQPQDLLALTVFLIVAVVISQLLGRSRTGLTAAMAREREATRLYELSTALAGLQDDRAIVRVIADHALEGAS